MSGIPALIALNLPNKYNPFLDKKEPFNTTSTSSSSSSKEMSVTALLMNILNIIICFGAMYYAFKCGGHFLDILAACCCSLCYLGYRLAVGCPI